MPTARLEKTFHVRDLSAHQGRFEVRGKKAIERQENPERGPREFNFDVRDLVFLKRDLLEGFFAASFRIGHGPAARRYREEEKK